MVSYRILHLDALARVLLVLQLLLQQLEVAVGVLVVLRQRDVSGLSVGN